MFDIYMVFSFLFMGLIFLRQISIFKKPNKINYAPLMLGIGAIASVIHFIISPENQTLLLTLKGSFIPFLVSLMLYIVMNIMHQTQVAENERVRAEFTQALVEQLAKLKSFTENLEARMVEYAKEERELRNEFMLKFNQDVQTLGKLLENQEFFIQHLDDMKKWHQEIMELIINFTEFKFPELDGVIHKHIDMIRIVESEHFEKISHYLQETLGDKNSIKEELQNLNRQLLAIENKTEFIAKDITEKTLFLFAKETQNLQKHFQGLLSQSEALSTTIFEGEGSLENLKKQSAFLVNQILLAVEHMEELQNEYAGMKKLSETIAPLVQKVYAIQQEYKETANELQAIASSMQENEIFHLEQFTQQTKEVLEQLDKKVDDTLEDIKQKYVLATDNISDNVKILAKKAQMQKGGYSPEDIL